MDFSIVRLFLCPLSRHQWNPPGADGFIPRFAPVSKRAAIAAVDHIRGRLSLSGRIFDPQSGNRRLIARQGA
jgi:hypothetical protein